MVYIYIFLFLIIYPYLRKFTIRSWLSRLWRLTSSKFAELLSGLESKDRQAGRASVPVEYPSGWRILFLGGGWSLFSSALRTDWMRPATQATDLNVNLIQNTLRDTPRIVIDQISEHPGAP